MGGEQDQSSVRTQGVFRRSTHQVDEVLLFGRVAVGNIAGVLVGSSPSPSPSCSLVLATAVTFFVIAVGRAGLLAGRSSDVGAVLAAARSVGALLARLRLGFGFGLGLGLGRGLFLPALGWLADRVDFLRKNGGMSGYLVGEQGLVKDGQRWTDLLAGRLQKLEPDVEHEREVHHVLAALLGLVEADHELRHKLQKLLLLGGVHCGRKGMRLCSGGVGQGAGGARANRKR